MINNISNYLESFASVLPVEIFATIGSFVEEVIAPIPSPVVMVLSGTLTHAQNYPLIYIFVLAILGSIGKTLGAWILYVLADKLEDVLINKFGKFLGVSKNEIENIGKRLSGSWKDDLLLFIARAIPIIPSAPISIACGAIKLNKRTYIVSTFSGTFVRNLMYLYLGYAGMGNYKEISQGFEGLESYGQLFLFLVILVVVVWAYFHRKKINHNK